MDTIYQYTIIVDLTLLAILVVMFVFASSLYRGAAVMATKEEEEAIVKRKEFIDAERKKLLKKFEGINEDDFSAVVRSEINKLDDAISLADKDIVKARSRISRITLRQLVFVPGILLFASIIVSGIALATATVIVWVTSFVLTLVGVYLICRNLQVIESFSKVIDLGTLMEQALDRHVDKLKPVVGFRFWSSMIGDKLTINCGEEKKIEYLIFLDKGTKGKDVRIRFSCSEELDFPGMTVIKDDIDYAGMKNPKRFWTEKLDLNPKEYKKRALTLKAPEIPGEYIMAYWVQCEEYTSDEQFFTISVI